MSSTNSQMNSQMDLWGSRLLIGLDFSLRCPAVAVCREGAMEWKRTRKIWWSQGDTNTPAVPYVSADGMWQGCLCPPYESPEERYDVLSSAVCGVVGDG